MRESILLALAGGALIGLSSSAMMFFVGRIAGISGILGGALKPVEGDTAWRLLFLAGLVTGGFVLAAVSPGVFQVATGRGILAIAGAGILVGIGTRLGNGCTSGHGVCGLSRLSSRSLVAVLTFVAAGIVSATLAGNLGGAQ
jgi:uncharacterized membrane protein YedE/YeeE